MRAIDLAFMLVDTMVRARSGQAAASRFIPLQPVLDLPGLMMKFIIETGTSLSVVQADLDAS